MFEYKGVEFTLEELQEEASKRNVSFEQFLQNNPDIQKIEKPFNEGVSPDFPTPTTPGAVVEETAAPDMESKSENGFSELAKSTKEFIEKNPIANYIVKSKLRKAQKKALFGLAVTNTIGDVMSFGQGLQETKVRALQNLEKAFLPDSIKEYLDEKELPTPGEALGNYVDTVADWTTDEDGFFGFTRELQSKIKTVGQDDPEATMLESFKSGNYDDGFDKLTNGIVEAVPSVLAAIYGGPVGFGTIFASASGSSYREKIQADPTKKGDIVAFGTSMGQGAVELVSEVVTKGILKGSGNIFGSFTPKTVKELYKNATKTMFGKVLGGGSLEATSENVAQETNRFIDYLWGKGEGVEMYRNEDNSYDIGQIWHRLFDTGLVSFIIGGGLAKASPAYKAYGEERLAPSSIKKQTIETANRIKSLEIEYNKNPNPLIENEILELQKQVLDNKILNERVLNSFEDSELYDYATKKISVQESRQNLKNIKNPEQRDIVEKIIEKQDKKLEKTYNNQKALILMLNFGPKATNAEIRQKVSEKKSQSIREQVNNTYDNKTTNADWKSKVADQAIIKLIGKYGDDGTPQGPLGAIIKNKITGEMTRLPGFSRSDFISEVVTELTPHIRNFKPELAAANPKNNLTGWIGGFIDNKIAGVLGGKKATKEQFETEISGVQETQFDLDNSTQEALDLQGTRTPEQNAKLNDIAGITKEEAQQNARQILKSKLPGILEKSGRDKNQIRTAINNASVLKVSDKILNEMGGKFTAKEGANNQFASFLGVHYDTLFGDNNIIPDYVKNKLELFKPKQVGRETMIEGDQAGKGKFEYQNPTFDQVLNFYTDETKGLSTLRARKERLADIIAPEIIKNEMAEALADPDVKKDFLERQKFLKKEIPQDAIPRLLQRIDRMIEGVDQFGKTTFQGGPIPVVPAAKVFLKSLKTLIKSGVKFSEALSKAIEKFKQALKGATKEQKSLAERILNYHIKSIEDLNKLQESDLIEDLNFFMASGVLEISENDFKNENIWWTKFAKNNKIKILDSKNSADVKRFREWTANVLPKYFGKEFVTLGTFANAGKSAAKRNFFFESIQEVENTVKDSKFQKDDADITAAVTKQVYTTGTGTKRKVQDKFKNELWGSENLKKQNAQKLKGLQKIFAKFEQMIKDDPKNKGFIMAMLQSTSQSQSHFIRTSAPIKFLAKNIDGEKVVEEHTLPASLVAKYLFNSALNGKVNKNFTNIKNNYFQGLLSAKDDNKMKGKGKDNKPFNYKEVTPEGWLITDNIWARYFNINVALQDGGIMPENIILEDGKSVAEKFNINNAGYGIKGKNLNTSVIFQHKIDEANKENAKQIYAEKDLNKEFNEFLEKSTGIGAEKVFSKAKAEARAKTVRKGFGDYFVPPSAEDFAGLMHKTLAKGKEGEKQLKFYQDNLYTPYNVANENITRERAAMFEDFRALKKNLSNVPKKLKQLTKGGDFTYDQAVRVYMWNKLGQKVPGLSESDLKSLVKEVNDNKELNQFANELLNITKGDGYAKPENNWMGGNIATDLMGLMNSSKRSKHLEVWQNNVDQIFSKENLNKLEAAYGKEWVVNLNKTLERMKTGMNRKWGGDKVLQSYLDWVNGSVGAIMFLNTRSAVLQTISNINYLNFSDNNPLKAAAAFANQKQYWKDFKTIFNSDYLQERRGGNKINVNESELALAAEKGGIQGAISLLLNKGFIFTKIADSFAIASGGASMYRNRINKYVKEGLSEKEATEKAFIDFKAITEETQQSSRPDRISEQQASNAGRLLLAFANTPMQYNRIIKKNAQDLIAGRGNKAEKISKIIYYSTVQNLMFNAMQKALFALAFADGEEEEKEIEKYSEVANGMADSLLRGMGMTGNAAVAIKNIATDVAKRMDKPRPNFQDAAWKALTISPPIYSKVSKLRGAGYSLGYTTPENIFEPKLDNPALSAGANIISATTNVPLDRALRKAQNIEAAMSDEAEWWQSTALLMGWGSWELDMKKPKTTKKKKGPLTAVEIEEKIRKNLEKLK